MNVEERIGTKKVLPINSKTIIHYMLVNNAITEAIGKALKPFDVSSQQFNVLRILRGQDGQAANLSTINNKMISKMSNTTRLVDKLLLKGYVNRIVCPSNRRKIEITITEKGKKALLKMDKAIEATENQLLHRFSGKELKQFNELLNKF